TLANSGGRCASSTRMQKMPTSMAVLDAPTKANVAGATRRAGLRNFAIAAFFRFWRQVKKLRCADYTNFCQQTRLCWTRLDVCGRAMLGRREFISWLGSFIAGRDDLAADPTPESTAANVILVAGQSNAVGWNETAATVPSLLQGRSGAMIWTGRA